MSEESQQSMPPDPDTIDRLADIARALDRLGERDIHADDKIFRRAQLYRRAAELVVDDPVELSEFLTEYLLRDCVAIDHRVDSGRGSIDRDALRGILATWLDSLPEDLLWRVRPTLVGRAMDLIANNPSYDCLYLIPTIGYREERVLTALRQVALARNDLAPLALRLMLQLAVYGDSRRWIREQINLHASRPSPSIDLQQAIALLATDDAAETLHRIGLGDEKNWFIYGAFGLLCDHVPNSLPWQDRIWDAMVDLSERRENGWPQLLFIGGGVERCHTPRVLGTLCAQLSSIANLGDIHVHRLASQVEMLTSQRQIEGSRRADATLAQDVLRRLAVASTGSTTRSMTFEAYLKRDALQLALILGTPEVMSWVGDAVDNEENTYQQHSFMETAAVLSISQLPHSVVQLLSSHELSFSRTGNDSEVLRFLGAARLAASSQSRDSLQLLLGAAGLIDGHPFRSPVDHGAELADWMVRNGDSAALHDLTEALSSQRPMECGIAVRAFLSLARENSSIVIPDVAIARLEGIACDEEREPYLRADAIWARAPLDAFSPAFERKLADLCDREDDQLRTAAAHALIGRDLLAQHREAIERCAFRSSGGLFEVSKKLTNYEAHLIGRLAALMPATYGNVAGQVINSTFTFAVEETLRALQREKGRGGIVPEEVTAAIIEHIFKYESRSFAHMSLFESLAKLNPSALLSEDWESVWDGWMADSRQALADSLVVAMREPGTVVTARRAVAVANALLGDSNFRVRRSAARAMAQLDAETLNATCNDWLASASIILRERAAEMAGWLPIDDEPTLDNELLRLAARDTERRVRSAAERARHDAQRRHWAAEHLRVVMETDTSPNNWVLRRYASGVALANVGDDRDMAVLAHHARTTDVPPNVRHWYGQVLKNLERQWKETTRKSRDTWLPRRGMVERLQGLLVTEEHVYPARFSLWVEPRTDDDLAHWGGAAFVCDEKALSVLRGLLRDSASTVLIRIDGRVDGRVIVVNVTETEVLLSGSGVFPEVRS